jgi:hypothetical protein
LVSEGRGRLFRRKDGKYLLYLPVDLAEDSMFPFKEYTRTKRGAYSIPVKINFKHGENKLTIEKWKEPSGQ